MNTEAGEYPPAAVFMGSRVKPGMTTSIPIPF